jgi:hypothetical protein
LNRFSNRVKVFVDSPLLLGYLLLIFSYLPGVLRSSFWSDDFPAIIETRGSALNLVSDTRPVWGAGLYIFFSIAEFTGIYIIPKLIGFLGLILLYRYICSLIQVKSNPRVYYLTFAIGFLLPSFGIWSHWSTSLFHSWSALLGLVAFEKYKDGRLKLSIVAMSISCLIYPPATVFFFGVIFFNGITQKRRSSELLTDLLSGLKVTIFGGVLSIVLAFSCIKILGLNPTSRVSIVSLEELPDKLVWFFSRPFALGFFPMTVYSPSQTLLLIVGMPIIFFILYAMVVGSDFSKKELVARCLILFVVSILSIFPLLLVNDNQIELRLTPGISWAFFCTSLFGLTLFLENHLAKRFQFIKVTIVFVIVAIASFGVIQRFENFYFHQDRKATDFIVRSIGACSHTDILLGVKIRDNTSSYRSMPHLGTFSMTSDMASEWVPRNRTIFVLKRHFPEYAHVPVVLNSQTASGCKINLENFANQVNADQPRWLF